MTAPTKLDYLATAHWLKDCPTGELSPDDTSTELLVGRWRVRHNYKLIRVTLIFGVALAAGVVLSRMLRWAFDVHVPLALDGLGYGLALLAFSVDTWWVRRREALLASRWSARAARSTTFSGHDLLGGQVVVLALVGATQMVTIAAIEHDHGASRAAMALIAGLLFWFAAGIGVRDAVNRPVVAIDDRTLLVDDWLRRIDALRACQAPLVFSAVVCVFGGTSAIMVGVMMLPMALSWMGSRTEQGRGWLFGTGHA